MLEGNLLRRLEREVTSQALTRKSKMLSVLILNELDLNFLSYFLNIIIYVKLQNNLAITKN